MFKQFVEASIGVYFSYVKSLNCCDCACWLIVMHSQKRWRGSDGPDGE